MAMGWTTAAKTRSSEYIVAWMTIVNILTRQHVHKQTVTKDMRETELFKEVIPLPAAYQG
jgi:hypothetical protein